MRSRLRTRPGAQAARGGSNLQLVRFRGSQRDSGLPERGLRARGRRRGGRGRSRGRAASRAPQQKQARQQARPFSLWAWLQGLFAPRPAAAPSAPPRTRSVEGFAEHESRVLAEFEKTFGIPFGNRALLKLALTHRSYLHVTGAGPRDSNERLEFLGDSVLGLVTSEHLYRRNPNEHEGQLTKTKSLLVSKAILSRRALAMGLGRFVLMSHSEVESGGRQRLSILADAFEAVIGAIYLDQGFGAARSFIERWLLREARVIVADKRHTNYKSHLQEYVQSTFRTHPVYRIRSAMGPDHSKQFMVEVMVGRKVLGEGRGRNKKEAEQAAARHALEQVGEATPASERTASRTADREERTSEPRPSRRAETPPPRAARTPLPAPPARSAVPPPPPPRPSAPRRVFDEDEHDEIGRPEGPEDDAAVSRERRVETPPAPAPPPVRIETESEPPRERNWPSPMLDDEDDEEETEAPAAVETRSEPAPRVEAPPPARPAPPSPAPPPTPPDSYGRRRKPGRR